MTARTSEVLPAIITRSEAALALVRTTPLSVLARKFLLWFKLVRQKSAATIEGYGHDLAIFCAFADRAGIIDPAAISFRELEMFMAWRQHEQGASAHTVNRSMHSLRQFFKWCVREGLVPTNPTELIEWLKTTRRLPAYMTIEELERVLAALAKDTTLLGRRNYALIATLTFTGLRVSELCNLRPEHVTLDPGTVRVVRGKGDKDRELPIVARLRTILVDYVEHVRPALLDRPRGHLFLPSKTPVWTAKYWVDGRGWVRRSTGTSVRWEAEEWLAKHAPPPLSPFLFVNASPTGRFRADRIGQPLLTRSIFSLVRATVSPILGRPVSPHVFRHSFASRLYENDCPIEVVKDALGHSLIQTTMIYTHLSTKKRRADLEKYLGGDEPARKGTAP